MRHHRMCFCLSSFYFTFWQIPDAKLGEDRVDGVVVDEESVGSGCGAKILYGDNALEEFLYHRNPENEMVCICYLIFSQ